MNRIPKLRFPEFSGEWEERRIKKDYELISGQHLNPNEYSSLKNNIPYFTGPSDFVNDIDKVTKWSLIEGKKAKYGDILFTVKGSGVGALTILKLSEVVMGRQLMAITSQKSSISFLSQYLKTKKEYFESLASGNMIPGLSRNDILDLKLYFAQTLSEQQEIASFLSSVDSKIEKLERKKELWEQYKKGMMQKIFSQELRFKDENGEEYPEWKVEELGKICEFSKGKGISKSDISEEGIECIRYGQLYTTYGEKIEKIISKTDLSLRELILSEENDIIIPSSGETAIDLATASCIMKSGVAIGGDINILKTDMNGVFLVYYLNNRKKREIADMAQGISVMHLYATQLKNLKIEIPLHQEQKQIADFLSSIDSKIEAVDKKLTGLKTFKNGLLQQMFI